MEQVTEEAKGNGHSDENVVAQSATQAEGGPVGSTEGSENVKKMDRVDTLEFKVLQERSIRLEAEKANLETQIGLLQKNFTENQKALKKLTDELAKKYKVSFETHMLNIDEGVITPRPPQQGQR